MNIRSLSGKFSEFVTHLNLLETKFTVLVVTETWLKESTDVAYDIDGYNCFSLHRENQIGGGIKLYVDDSFDANVVQELTSVDGAYERLFIKLNVPGLGDITVGGIYRPPSKSVNAFCEQLNDVLTCLNISRCVLLGDFNIDVLNTSNSQVQNLTDTFYQYNFRNDINLPTYHSPISNADVSCLDQIWHNLSIPRRSFVVGPNMSDHYAVCILFNKKNDSKVQSVKFRNFGASNQRNFHDAAQSEFSQFSPPSYNVNEYSVYLVKFLTKILNKYFPVKTKKISLKRINSPWITSAIIKCIRKKFRWHRLWKQNIIMERSYKEYAAELRSLLRVAEREYYVRRFNALDNDIKRNWKILNKLLGNTSGITSENFKINETNVTNPDIICHEFSRHFLEHPRNIHNSVASCSSNYMHNIPMNPVSMFLHHSTKEEVSLFIKRLRKNGGIHDISRRFLILCDNFVPEYMCKLFNMCIDESIFPDNLKTALITPVHKKGPKNIISHYRPISILLNFNKVFESLLHTRILSFFNSNMLLSNNQYGFRKGMNTELAVFNLISKVLPAIENKKFCISVFLDYSACFDTLSRPILFEKLYRYGVRGGALDLLKSYFSNRNQYVVYGNSKSECSQQQLGVIQGSKTGPLFFDIYSNDFNFLCTNDENILYADDTCLVYVGDCLETLVQHVNLKLSVILEWCNSNKLALNPTKSEFMLITNRKIQVQPQIFIGNNLIKCVDNFKYLGVNIDNKLKFFNQIIQVKGKLSKMCGVSFRLSGYFNKKAAMNMYYSCVYSSVSYCISVWGGVLLCTHRGDNLIRLHARTVKNLFNKFSPVGTCPFKANKILKLPDIFKLRVSIYMYKVMILNEHPTLRRDLYISYSEHRYNTREAGFLITPFPRVEVIRMNFKYQFVQIWNQIPMTLKELPTLRMFKRSLTALMFDNY